ncbi:hypothetical protein B0I35DRAFT_452676 [Stachybotrys elegans]|uniref:ER-bound oxygenase mpaB/mpaB'/Rubber oxygenase catalytic domain-containing protein n=1 Tax=Stachybotrys elegans TaxID=80388 RepID=A0A8K0WNH7_9HYPO|nr:hypothetical protein B0I35DRAFT_452676 [Stachybotrys elegans]
MAEKIGGNSYKYAGHRFAWTSLHLSKEDTSHFSQEYDELGSKAAARLQEISRSKSRKDTTEVNHSDDMYSLLKDHYQEDKILTEFWGEVHTVPEWVDWEQLKRGQEFFYRYAVANIMGFALQGFVGENTASAGVVEVLVRTGGFSVRTLRRRLLSTFQFILEVSESIEALRAGGTGHTTAIRVRLLHASVRNRIMSLAEKDPGYFDVRKHGIPLNTLDSIHSISTFCCNHMWLQLPQMGVYPREQEIADYIALYRYMAYLLGTPDAYFSSAARAKATMESMLVNELELTPTSDIVLHNFVEFLTDLPPFNVSRDFVAAGSYRLNGDKFCRALGLVKPGWYASACFQGHCWLVRGLALLQQNSKTLDQRMSAWFRKNLHQAIIHGKAGLSGGSKMRFKYVPRLGRLTGKETAEWHQRAINFYQRPVEMAFFTIFVLGCLNPLGCKLCNAVHDRLWMR